MADVVYRAKNDVVARRTRCARFVTDRYNLVRRGSRDAPGCTRGTIVSQVTVSSFMHGRNHYWRLCIRVNGIPASDPFSPLFFSFFFSLTRAVSNVAAATKIQFQFPNPSCNQSSCKHIRPSTARNGSCSNSNIQNRRNYCDVAIDSLRILFLRGLDSSHAEFRSFGNEGRVDSKIRKGRIGNWTLQRQPPYSENAELNGGK